MKCKLALGIGIPLALVFLCAVAYLFNVAELKRASPSFRGLAEKFMASETLQGTEVRTFDQEPPSTRTLAYLKPSYSFEREGKVAWLDGPKWQYRVSPGGVEVSPSFGPVTQMPSFGYYSFDDKVLNHEIAACGDRNFGGAPCHFFELRDDVEPIEDEPGLLTFQRRLEGSLGRGIVQTFYFRKSDGMFQGETRYEKGKLQSHVVCDLHLAPGLTPADFLPEKFFAPDVVAEAHRKVQEVLDRLARKRRSP